MVFPSLSLDVLIEFIGFVANEVVRLKVLDVVLALNGLKIGERVLMEGKASLMLKPFTTRRPSCATQDVATSRCYPAAAGAEDPRERDPMAGGSGQPGWTAASVHLQSALGLPDGSGTICTRQEDAAHCDTVEAGPGSH